jgi:outer membrane immunogenic protein
LGVHKSNIRVLEVIMKKLTFAFAGALAVISVPALAADLGRMPTKAPAFVAAPVTNWNGFYIGIMGGYGWGRGRFETGLFDFSTDIDGGFIGGTLGFNFQAPGSPWVFGVEVDSAWANIRGSTTILGFGSGDAEIRYFGTARGRIGYAFGPSLLYATGGVAWANNRLNATTGIAALVAVSDSQSHVGWTLGAGWEWAFSPNWSAKIEYLYMDFGRETYFAGIAGFGGGVTADAQVHTVKAGINYRFNWGGPVVASY